MKDLPNYEEDDEITAMNALKLKQWGSRTKLSVLP
jgi:hypothetical protein